MINLINPNQPTRQLKHVIPQRNDNELRVLGALLDVGGYDGDLFTTRQHTSISNTHSPSQASSLRVVKVLTFRKSNAASISSITYNGVGR